MNIEKLRGIFERRGSLNPDEIEELFRLYDVSENIRIAEKKILIQEIESHTDTKIERDLLNRAIDILGKS